MCLYFSGFRRIFSDPCYWAVIYAYTVQTLGVALQAIEFWNIGKEHANKAHMSK